MHRTLFGLAAAALLAGSSPALAKAPGKTDVARYAERALQGAYAADGPGAALLVARGDQVLYRGARGLASIELGVPLQPTHAFRIGSVTKQFAAASLLKLVDAGKVGLDDPLSKYLPDYPGGTAISIRQLLNHTSGVKSYTSLPEVMAGTIRQDVSTAELIASFKDQPADFAPGEDWSYNNSGYVLLGAVIEAASGKPWHEWLQEAVLAPAGLDRTVYGADEALIPGMARGYAARDGQVIPAAYLSMTQPHAAGALVSTLDDLHRWNRALHGGKLLPKPLYAAMTAPEGKAEAAGYGFGIVRGKLRGRDQLQHGGGIFGFSSHLLYVPEADLTVAVLQNSNGSVDGNDDPARLAMQIAAFALGDPYPEAKPVPVALETLQSYEGVYRIDENTTRVVRVVDGVLTTQRTGGAQFPMIPIADDTFLYENSFSQIRFERDAAGQPGMRFFLEGEGEGDFVARSDEAMPSGREAIALSSEQMSRVLGSYAYGPMQMKVFVDNGQLKTQLDGQPALDLFAETPNRFFLTVVDATLDAAPQAGTVAALVLHQGGQEIEFKRVD